MANEKREYGDLVVTLTSAYDWRWNDKDSGAKRDGAFWHPKPQGQLCALGSVAVPHYGDINNHWAVLLVGDNPSKRLEGRGPAVQRPVDYQGIWNDRGSGAKHDGSFWRPVPPPGYLSVGDVAWYGHGKPDLDQIWCLRIDLVNDGTYKDGAVWDDVSSGADVDSSFWAIVPQAKNDSSQYIPVLAGTFRCNAAHSMPDTSLARVPALYLPRNNKNLSPQPPAITPDSIPEIGDTFSETVQSTVTLPFTSFFDPGDRSCLDNIRDPFCSLSKKISWVVLDKHPNFQDSPQEQKTEVKVGIRQSSTTTTSHGVGVTISTEAGYLLSKFSVSLNYQFTYSQSNSLEEIKERTLTKTITVAPHTISIVWSRRVLIQGARADGSRIGSEISFNGEEVAVVDVPLKG